MSRIAFIGYLNYVKDAQAFYWLNPSCNFTQESRTTLIGCAESVPARKYKITCSPAKGVLFLFSTTQESSSKPFGLTCMFHSFHVSNTLTVLPTSRWNKTKVTKIVFVIFTLHLVVLDSTQPYSIRLKQTKHAYNFFLLIIKYFWIFISSKRIHGYTIPWYDTHNTLIINNLIQLL